VRKVVVFIVENHSLDQMRDQMPFTFGLATTYGHATDYTAMTHPSLPNYLAIVSGSTQGVTDDRDPSALVLRDPTVLGQAVRAGHTAAVYAEGMPENCALTNGGSRYAVRHNPWAYFVDERSQCQQYDVPLGALTAANSSGRLPTVSLVIPDLRNDAHDCSLAAADAWLSKQVTPLMQGRDWRSGRLAVVVTADEDDRHHGNNVLTVVANPALHGKVVTEPLLNHLSLSRSLSEVSGSTPLNQAAAAPSLLAVFGLKTAL
jgi:acid phosphatase